MKNIIKSVALAGVLAIANAEQAEQQSQKSAAEQHKEAIAAQTKRWTEATKDGVPSAERIQELIVANRRIIQEIWEKEAKHKENTRNQ